jgi:hypothetical protein
MTESKDKSHSLLSVSLTLAIISSNPSANFLTYFPVTSPLFSPYIVSKSTCKALLDADDEGWARDELGEKRLVMRPVATGEMR